MIFVLLAVFAFCTACPAAGLLWPLPGYQTLTGGFADSRPDHFHGGVDVRTERQTLPVVAPDDGWIERIAVTPAGYGRTLYLRLSDGRTAVFAHLSRFVPPLETILRDAELAEGTYRVDVSFAESSIERSFRRGDTLAYSGGTGSGPPHFHFELRDGSVQIDPLAEFPTSDSLPPVIVSVAWTTLSRFSPASAGTRLAIKKTAPGRWEARHLSADEPVAFFIKAYDPDRPERRTVPALFRLRVNGEIVYEDQASQIDLTGRRDIYSKLVWPAVRRDHLDPRRLFVVPPPPSDLKQRAVGGWINAVQDADVVLEVANRVGVTSTISLRVTAGSWPSHSSAELPIVVEVGRFTLRTGGDAAAAWAKVQEVSEREIEISPSGLAFGDRLRLEYRLEEGESPNGLFFYERDSRGRIQPLAPAENGDTPSLSCLILRAGTYGVGMDTDPPFLRLRSRSGVIRYRLTDNLSGVDDRSIRCTVDGRTAVPEFEYDAHGGAAWTPQPLAPGRHAVEFSAADRAGNSRTWQTTVTVR
jgi:hypothetical protein